MNRTCGEAFSNVSPIHDTSNSGFFSLVNPIIALSNGKKVLLP